MPEQIQTPPQSLYSQKMSAKGKTYFFDVREAKNGNKYLSITESRIKGDQKFRSTISVFPNNLEEFRETVSAMQDKLA